MFKAFISQLCFGFIVRSLCWIDLKFWDLQND